MILFSDAEWTVLEVLWQKDTFCLGEVVDALKPLTNWSRNTVHTYLTRMEAKQAVVIDRSGEPHQYSAAVSREQCARSERSKLLDKVYRGAAGDLIAAFLKESKISAEEREHLRGLLDDMDV
ncbi:MAG: BlaI/MecI/CopY family transcriptional regulator [Oscillospiraceae bacterium]|jgi:BlaI family penicillinase repressor|nr:BlaI/MecI/CopY family transcriptional regulator [Oscillospiraceae bacterium]